MTLSQELESRLLVAINSVLPDFSGEATTKVNASADLRFGDYQANAAMILAKQAKMNPRQLAQNIVDEIDCADLAEVSIAGPGFINFTLTKSAWSARMNDLFASERLGVPLTGNDDVVVLDFSAPNVAKPMHVGHIRSIIIGDSLARIARFLGFNVVTDNHIGDWGTQFGMILYAWKHLVEQSSLVEDPIAELVRGYREVNTMCKDDESILQLCKDELVKLQAGDEENLAIWQQCIDHSKEGLQKIYDQLDVSFDHWLGESHYNDRLAPLVEEFIENGLARESEGAICVFSGETGKPEDDPYKTSRDGEWNDNPAIIRKADGGFLYATTDLATIDFRVNDWKAKHIWYVVGAPQQLHFRQVFDAAKRWGRTGNFKHIAFGSILGEDRKLMKTRSGDNVGLVDVLEEAVERAKKAIEEKNPNLKGDEKDEVAEIVGLGAIKFAELSQNRMTDYVFHWDRLLALTGDTAPYLQYSYVRVRSIFRKMSEELDLSTTNVEISEEAEIHLARMLSRFGEVVPAVLDDFKPNVLASYLLELARAFHSFFEACPVLKAETEVRNSRLVLCELTSRVLVKGLDLLGIRVPEKM